MLSSLIYLLDFVIYIHTNQNAQSVHVCQEQAAIFIISKMLQFVAF